MDGNRAREEIPKAVGVPITALRFTQLHKPLNSRLFRSRRSLSASFFLLFGAEKSTDRKGKASSA
jgi:hypothetical protein